MPKKKIQHYNFNAQEYEAYKWCINNDILIAPFAKSDVEWWIEINNKGKLHRSPEFYSHKDLWPKIFEFYLYYFEKYANKI